MKLPTKKLIVFNLFNGVFALNELSNLLPWSCRIPLPLLGAAWARIGFLVLKWISLLFDSIIEDKSLFLFFFYCMNRFTSRLSLSAISEFLPFLSALDSISFWECEILSREGAKILLFFYSRVNRAGHSHLFLDLSKRENRICGDMFVGAGRWWDLCVMVAVIAGSQLARSSASQIEEPRSPVTRIAFGSCANQSAPQPIWDGIINFDPQVFIWLGDNIYGDIRRPFKLIGKERTFGPWKNTPRFVPSSEQEMEFRYKKAKTNPGYSRLRKGAKVFGTWDDHDFGLNDAGKEFEGKITNQRLLLDFLDEPHDSTRRKQHGVYTSYTLGPKDRQIKVILLDTRYHRDPLFSDGTILGSAQWTWLEKELKGPASALTIVGSSIQVISNLSATTGPFFYLESWGRFPKERARLMESIADSKREGVLFISGDVHFGEISRYDCAIGYPLYDITSSGLTQAVEKVVPPPLHVFIRFMAWLTPTTMRVTNRNCRYSSCTYGQPNFGTIEIDWNATPVTLKLEVRDANGIPTMGVNLSLNELHRQSVDPLPTLKAREVRRHCTLEVDLPLIIRYRLAILFSFAVAVLLLSLAVFVYATASAWRRWRLKCKHD